MFDNVETDEHGLNVKIQSHLLSEEEMRKIGFTDRCGDHWHYERLVSFPREKQKEYSWVEISFNVNIPKDGSRLQIDVLDEDFCQPYDYQRILSNKPSLELPLIVQEFVEQQMEYLQQKGVLSGHIRGEYI